MRRTEQDPNPSQRGARWHRQRASYSQFFLVDPRLPWPDSDPSRVRARTEGGAGGPTTRSFNRPGERVIDELHGGTHHRTVASWWVGKH